MKKILLSFLALGGLLFASSCQMDEPDAGTLTGEVDFTITAGIPGSINTYASNDGGSTNVDKDNYDQRFILEVYDGENYTNLAYREVKTVEVGEKTSFDVRLLAKKYTFALWADFVEDGSEGDNIYNTSNGLREVTIKENRCAGSEVADAYCYSEEVDLTEGSLSKTFNLKRPFGKIRLISTDKPANDVNSSEGYTPTSVTVTYGTDVMVPTGYNVLTGEASGKNAEAGGYTFKPYLEDVSAGGTDRGELYILGIDYIIASKSATSVSFDVKVDDNGARSVTNIPVSANKLTTVIGNFYTNEGNIDVVVDDMFDEDDIEVPVTEIFVVTSDDDLQAIINAAEPYAVIELEPGTYSGDYDFVAGKSLTFRGANAGINPNTGSRQEETIFTGTLGASRLSTDEVYDMEIVIDGIKFTGEGTKIANSQYNAIGELTVQNCIFEPTTTDNNFFIATNHNANESCRSTIRLINNHIGNTTTDYRSYYPVRLWAVKNVEVIGNVFEVDPGFAGLQHINISNLSGSEDASIIVKNNTFTNGPAGVTISSWKVGETPWSEDLFTGTIEITGNTFNNVGLTSIENPLRNNVPIFISPEYIDDDVTKGRVQDHGQFDADITVEDNKYNGELRENVIVNLTVHISTVDELKAAIKNQTDGQKWYIAAGEYDLGDPGQADAPGPNGYYFKVDKSLSIIGEGEVIITTSHDAESGMGSLQNLVTVNAKDVSFENITFKANYNSDYSGPNKIIEVRNTRFSISDCKFIPNEKAPKDCGSAVYFSQNADNGVVENCEINYATVSFDGLMKGNFTVKNNTFVEGNGNFAITTPNWTSNNVTTSNLNVNLTGNTFEGFEEFSGDNPAVRVSYGIFNLNDNVFPTDGIYWKSAPCYTIPNSFGAVFVDYDSVIDRKWTAATNEKDPKSFAISNDIVEMESTDVRGWSGRKASVRMVPKSSWEVTTNLKVTDDNTRVSKIISLFLPDGYGEFVQLAFKQDASGNRKWQYWGPYDLDEDGNEGIWHEISGVSTEPGEYYIKITFKDGSITYNINYNDVAYQETGVSNAKIGSVALESYSYGESYKATWGYPVITIY